MSYQNPNWNPDNYFDIADNSIVAVKDNKLNSQEIRVYCSENYKYIANNVFDECNNLSSLMISNGIEEIGEQNWPETLTLINYTGSSEEYANLGLNISNVSIEYYALDEGFINYWNAFVRPTSETSICDQVGKDKYEDLNLMYTSLSEEDLEQVNDYKDLSGASIKSSMSYLKALYSGQETRPVEKETSSALMITLILVTATIGMTFIAVMYLLKQNKIIN